MVLLTRPMLLVPSSASPGSPPLEELSGVRAFVRSLAVLHTMAYKLLKPTVPQPLHRAQGRPGPQRAWAPCQ